MAGGRSFSATAIRRSGRKIAVFNQADGDPETCKAYFEQTCEMLDQDRLAAFEDAVDTGVFSDAFGLLGVSLRDDVVVNGRVIGRVRGLKVRLTATARVEARRLRRTA